MDDYTIKSFSEAFNELKEKLNVSLGQLSIKTGLSKSFLSDISNSKVLPPKDEFIVKIAGALKVSPDYFFEYRLRRFTEFLNGNRDFLNKCITCKNQYLENRQPSKK
ncbi:MAG: helix-turn-helix transcriptional regulator [Actinobacteria bacterium]|nr:helix-turn-helix transcriptional regulator [Actinomycetota bacterium]